MSPLSAGLLGLLQALTEFLPISSSGHLVLARALFSVQEAGLAFDVAVHLGTLVSVLFFFRGELLSLFTDLFRVNAWRGGAIGQLAIATCPAVFAGLSLKDFLEAELAAPLPVSLALVFTGITLLLFARREGIYEAPTMKVALLIGCAQALAILPGISRAGMTITAGLLLGLSRDAAFRFSFLLSIPVIAGAGLLQGLDLLESPPSAAALQGMLIGAVVAGSVGLLVLGVLRKILVRGYFHHFGYYCLGVGLSALLYF
ncbi:MAG: undecaprenyl-diphosphate phosphatase [Myxococcota bacterium]|nr:undecaprenyl-diphosphate phosphatase [Myxococcota bacterium]